MHAGQQVGKKFKKPGENIKMMPTTETKRYQNHEMEHKSTNSRNQINHNIYLFSEFYHTHWRQRTAPV